MIYIDRIYHKAHQFIQLEKKARPVIFFLLFVSLSWFYDERPYLCPNKNKNSRCGEGAGSSDIKESLKHYVACLHTNLQDKKNNIQGEAKDRLWPG